MSTGLSETKPRPKRRLVWLLLIPAFFVAAFFLGPAAIRASYARGTSTAEVDLLKQRYRALDTAESGLPKPQRLASARRRFEISRWLEMRGVAIDAGIRDEGIEHAPFPIAVFGMTRWAWEDIGRYWAISRTERTPQYLLSDVH